MLNFQTLQLDHFGPLQAKALPPIPLVFNDVPRTNRSCIRCLRIWNEFVALLKYLPDDVPGRHSVIIESSVLTDIQFQVLEKTTEMAQQDSTLINWINCTTFRVRIESTSSCFHFTLNHLIQLQKCLCMLSEELCFMQKLRIPSATFLAFMLWIIFQLLHPAIFQN